MMFLTEIKRNGHCGRGWTGNAVRGHTRRKRFDNRTGLTIAAALLCLLVQSSLIAAECAPAASGIVAWWPGNGDANDIIGTNNATFVNESYADAEVAQGFNL